VQGDIEKVAQKSPAQMTQFFEIISGSDACKAEYEELQEAASKAEEATAVVLQNKRQLTQRKRSSRPKTRPKHSKSAVSWARPENNAHFPDTRLV
jgi:chromosome segregation ATPase